MSGRYELLYFSIPTLIVAYLFAHRFLLSGWGKILRLIQVEAAHENEGYTNSDKVNGRWRIRLNTQIPN